MVFAFLLLRLTHEHDMYLTVQVILHNKANIIGPQRRDQIILDAVSGMKYLHSLGRIHRDLKR